jgi:hypothetical protein
MSEIKLPVTVEGHAFCTDAEDNILSVRDVAAALNAAPKRAFAELTADAVGAILSEAADKYRHPVWSKMDEIQASIDERHAFILARLQAFAAPVAPEGYVLVHKELIQFDITGYPAMEAKARELSARSCDRAKRGVGVDPVILLEEAEELLKAGLAEMPLPAAPGTQGGREDV